MGKGRLAVCGLVGSVLVAGACGSSDEKKNVRAAGGEGGAAGEAGASSELRCGSATCSDVSRGDIILPACCPGGRDDVCGFDVTQVAEAMGLVGGCIEVAQTGDDDASCPGVSLTSPVDGSELTADGCCRAGSCGVRVDVRSEIGIDFGCVDVGALADEPAPMSCGAGGAGGTGGAPATQGGASGAPPEGGAGGAAPVEPMCSVENPCVWRQAMPQDSPPVLAWGAMAYDPATEEIILFGGAPTINGGTLTDQTWSWNGSNWQQLTPDDSPSARWTHGMVYDEARSRIVLFGGQSTDQPGSGLDDTWEWYDGNWHEVVTDDAPDPRGVHGAIAYDSVRERVVIRGGGTMPGQTIFNDTWEYDGVNWAPVAGAGPDALVAPAIAYDEARSQILYFGGGTWSPYQDRTWTFNGSMWTELFPTDKPEPRQSARLVYDPTRSLLILFGGDNGSLLNDMWEWDGANWAEVDVAGPPARCCYAYAHDTGRSATVLFGGPDDQTWVYSQ